MKKGCIGKFSANPLLKIHQVGQHSKRNFLGQAWININKTWRTIEFEKIQIENGAADVRDASRYFDEVLQGVFFTPCVHIFTDLPEAILTQSQARSLKFNAGIKISSQRIWSILQKFQ